jgi:hypothetical protein
MTKNRDLNRGHTEKTRMEYCDGPISSVAEPDPASFLSGSGSSFEYCKSVTLAYTPSTDPVWTSAAPGRPSMASTFHCNAVRDPVSFLGIRILVKVIVICSTALQTFHGARVSLRGCIVPRFSVWSGSVSGFLLWYGSGILDQASQNDSDPDPQRCTEVTQAVPRTVLLGGSFLRFWVTKSSVREIYIFRLNLTGTGGVYRHWWRSV